MTVSECSRIAKAYDMLTDYIGINYVCWPDTQDGCLLSSDFYNTSACILQQLIAEYEGWREPIVVEFSHHVCWDKTDSDLNMMALIRDNLLNQFIGKRVRVRVVEIL